MARSKHEFTGLWQIDREQSLFKTFQENVDVTWTHTQSCWRKFVVAIEHFRTILLHPPSYSKARHRCYTGVEPQSWPYLVDRVEKRDKTLHHVESHIDSYWPFNPFNLHHCFQMQWQELDSPHHYIFTSGIFRLCRSARVSCGKGSLRTNQIAMLPHVATVFDGRRRAGIVKIAHKLHTFSMFTINFTTSVLILIFSTRFLREKFISELICAALPRLETRNRQVLSKSYPRDAQIYAPASIYLWYSAICIFTGVNVQIFAPVSILYLYTCIYAAAHTVVDA